MGLTPGLSPAEAQRIRKTLSRLGNALPWLKTLAEGQPAGEAEPGAFERVLRELSRD